MIKIWFLLILMSIQDGNPLVYRGFMGYESQEKCLINAVKAENFMMDREMEKGLGDSRAVWIKSFCLPFEIFIKTEDLKKNENGITYES
tara:strand:+ start:1682 stop:1948 length:267 start_codon:yes stop_codon:yes gene_type:complete